MKKHIGKIVFTLVLMILIVAGAVMLSSCGKDDGEGAAIKYVDPSEKVTGTISKQLMSLLVAGENYNYSTFMDYLDTPMTEDGKTTLADVIVVQACATGEDLLRAEYLLDYVYNAPLSDAQNDSVEKAINAYTEEYGSKANFENALSAYGTDIQAVKRFMLLQLKFNSLYDYLYGNGQRLQITDEQLCEYFAKSYIIADHIYLSFLGEKKDDGTVAPLPQQEIEQKKALAENIYLGVQSGAYDFDEAVITYGEDSYKTMYKDGYFIPKVGISGLDEQVQQMLIAMSPGEIKKIETDSGIYIARRNEMDSSLCLTIPEFASSLRYGMQQADFKLQLDVADGTVLDKDVINQLSPKTIPALDIITAFAPIQRG